jgi:O-antigen ligase
VAGVLVCIVLVYLTQSRGALLAVGLVLVLLATTTGVLRVAGALSALTALVAVAVLLVPGLGGQLGGTAESVRDAATAQDESSSARSGLWAERLRDSDWVLGTGYGGYAERVGVSPGDDTDRARELLTIDNGWLKLLLEEGIPGVVVLALIIGLAVAAGLRARGGPDEALGLIAAAALVAIAFRGASADVFDIAPWNFLFWLIIGLALGARPGPGRAGAAR